MKQLAPYLNFAGTCRAAMEFYRDCLGGELKLMTLGESPMGAQASAEAKNSIMHANLVSGNIVIMASDRIMNADPDQGGNMFHIMLDCSDEAETRRIWGKLSAGGKVGHALEKQFWGALFGDFTDKFGIRWMLNCEMK